MMIRLVRASRLVKRWQTMISVSNGALSMTKCLVANFMFAHWYACIWTLQATLNTRVAN